MARKVAAAQPGSNEGCRASRHPSHRFSQADNGDIRLLWAGALEVAAVVLPPECIRAHERLQEASGGQMASC